MCSEFMLLNFSGRRLKIVTPFTPRDLSLAFFTTVGAALATGLGSACIIIQQVMMILRRMRGMSLQMDLHMFTMTDD